MKYIKPTSKLSTRLPKLNPQDLVNKERSFLKIIRDGILQILALLPQKDEYSKNELKKLNGSMLTAIKILLNIYDLELKYVPTDQNIVRTNIVILSKVKVFFEKGEYQKASDELISLQS